MGNLPGDHLDFLRIYVFARSAHYHITYSAFDTIAALLVNACKVSGAEPSVRSESLCSALGILVVAREDVRTPCHYLAFSCSRVDIVETQLHSIDRLAYLARNSVLVAAKAEQRRTFGQAVANMVRETGLLQEALHFDVELGSSDSEKAQTPSEGLDHLLPYQLAKGLVHVLVHPMQEFGLLEHRDYASLVHLLDDERH